MLHRLSQHIGKREYFLFLWVQSTLNIKIWKRHYKKGKLQDAKFPNKIISKWNPVMYEKDNINTLCQVCFIPGI